MFTDLYVYVIALIIIIIIIKSLFQEGNTISTKLISLAALKYIQTYTNKQLNVKLNMEHTHTHTHTHTSQKQCFKRGQQRKNV